MSSLASNSPPSVRRAHVQGVGVLVLATILGIVAALWLVTWSAEPKVFLSLDDRPETIGVPRPRTGLIPTNENRGLVLFGRYCDSCHTAGRETSLGASLRSAQFKREFNTEAKIIEKTRKGGFDMPAYEQNFLSDADLTEIARFVLGLPEEPR